MALTSSKHMGMRRNIELNYGRQYGKIYLYTHWGAEGLEKALAHALDRGRLRWNDDAYLARVIFTDMTQGIGDELTEYGLAPWECDPEFPTLTVDFGESTVNRVPFEDFIKNPHMFAI
jgi:hypothetical protein